MDFCRLTLDNFSPQNSDAESVSSASSSRRMVHATAKGGFLAPTKAWLLHMGEKVEYDPKVSCKYSYFNCYYKILATGGKGSTSQDGSEGQG